MTETKELKRTDCFASIPLPVPVLVGSYVGSICQCFPFLSMVAYNFTLSISYNGGITIRDDKFSSLQLRCITMLVDDNIMGDR